MVRETSLSVNDLIYPMFVVHGKNIKKEISSLPGNYHLSVDRLVDDVKEVHALGIPAVLRKRKMRWLAKLIHRMVSFPKQYGP
jgi:porphobilinogen synthase